MESNLYDVRPVSPAAPYIGGKRNLAQRVCTLIGSTPHKTYVEPFVGMGGVFLRRNRRPSAEVINDISGDVAGFFRILQRHYLALMDLLRWQITSRAEFDRLLAQDPDTLTDLERAARFLYVQRCAFGGKVAGRAFGVSVSNPGRFDVTKLAVLLPEIHERLAGVIIERLPYGQVIERYDSPDTLFYLDPPYWDCEGDYGPGVFSRSDFELLAEQLASIRGRFILSINATDGSRAVFNRFAVDEVMTTYSVGQKTEGARTAPELIVKSAGIDWSGPLI
ncbi:DNA methyltransferase [Sphingomonas sp. Leaf339]|uniref:DNA adenine methylase n=1 Tax=Sphingomonas sp. Leaf339 TaxID=1736343 RepID=UPI0006F76B5A|nr:DNA adenine methylase [Sphingomonas sp. Leaf339]KQU53214.1 DNA methyltransferase [Sphingomonas sp. Leaf339]